MSYSIFQIQKCHLFCPIHVKNTTGVTNELNLYSRLTNVTFLCPTHMENALGVTVELTIFQVQKCNLSLSNPCGESIRSNS